MKLDNIYPGQAFIKHEPTDEGSTSIQNPKIRAEINYRLGVELNGIIASPITGMQKIRKVLHRYGLDIPALYDLSADGDEVVIEMNQYGFVSDYLDLPQLKGDAHTTIYYLYILYYLNDTGSYDFYVEFTDKDGINSIMAETDVAEHQDIQTNLPKSNVT